jgi:transcriptional regulator with XRE-family HTH domain
MSNSAAAAETLRLSRVSIGVSQSKLARLSGVSRFKICAYELNGGSLNADDLNRIFEALHAEAERLRNVSIPNQFGVPQPSPTLGTIND